MTLDLQQQQLLFLSFKKKRINLKNKTITALHNRFYLLRTLRYKSFACRINQIKSAANFSSIEQAKYLISASVAVPLINHLHNKHTFSTKHETPPNTKNPEDQSVHFFLFEKKKFKFNKICSTRLLFFFICSPVSNGRRLIKINSRISPTPSHPPSKYDIIFYYLQTLQKSFFFKKQNQL